MSLAQVLGSIPLVAGLAAVFFYAGQHSRESDSQFRARTPKFDATLKDGMKHTADRSSGALIHLVSLSTEPLIDVQVLLREAPAGMPRIARGVTKPGDPNIGDTVKLGDLQAGQSAMFEIIPTEPFFGAWNGSVYFVVTASPQKRWGRSRRRWEVPGKVELKPVSRRIVGV